MAVNDVRGGYCAVQQAVAGAVGLGRHDATRTAAQDSAVPRTAP